MIAYEASTGMLSGRMILIKIWKSFAPSSLAFSIISRGMPDHVAVQKKDGERQCGRGLGEPYAQKTLADTDVHMQLQNGDQGNLLGGTTRPATTAAINNALPRKFIQASA